MQATEVNLCGIFNTAKAGNNGQIMPLSDFRTKMNMVVRHDEYFMEVESGFLSYALEKHQEDVCVQNPRVQVAAGGSEGWYLEVVADLRPTGHAAVNPLFRADNVIIYSVKFFSRIYCGHAAMSLVAHFQEFVVYEQD